MGAFLIPLMLIEAVVTSPGDCLIAKSALVDRIELCIGLEVGGLTPPLSLIDHAVRTFPGAVAVMIRPRGDTFILTSAEKDGIVRDAQIALEHGAESVVFGGYEADFRPDFGWIQEVVSASSGRAVFHRAIDQMPLPSTGEKIIGCGVKRILTAGGPGKAIDQVATLAKLIQTFPDNIVVGGGVRASNAREIVRQTEARALHLAPISIDGSGKRSLDVGELSTVVQLFA